MNTAVLPADPLQESAVEEILAGGGVVGFPTETYYGLACRIDREDALERLLGLKGDRGVKPLPLVLAAADRIAQVASSTPPLLGALIERFWPGPLSIVLAARPTVSRRVTASTGTVAVRLSPHPVARSVARLAGGVTTATSANPSERPPPRTCRGLLSYFEGRIALVVDGGRTAGGPPSTLVDLTSQPPRILRSGPVSGAAVVAILSRASAVRGRT